MTAPHRQPRGSKPVQVLLGLSLLTTGFGAVVAVFLGGLWPTVLSGKGMPLGFGEPLLHLVGLGVLVGFPIWAILLARRERYRDAQLACIPALALWCYLLGSVLT